MNWVIIGLIVVALIVVNKAVHFHHAKSRFFTILLILFVGIFCLSFYSVVQSNSIDLKNPSGIFSAVKIYAIWVGQAFNNLKIITGNAISLDWTFNSTH